MAAGAEPMTSTSEVGLRCSPARARDGRVNGRIAVKSPGTRGSRPPALFLGAQVKRWMMETLQEIEFIVGFGEVGSSERVRPLSQVRRPWGGWSLVPRSPPSRARLLVEGPFSRPGGLRSGSLPLRIDPRCLHGLRALAERGYRGFRPMLRDGGSPAASGERLTPPGRAAV